MRVRFDSVTVLGDYRDDLRTTILRMKRSSQESLSRALAELICDRLGEQLEVQEADVIVPVPMYWMRRLVRGTNSPEILSGRLAARLSIEVVARGLFRSRNTRPQASLPPGERWRNVRGAFGIRRGYNFDGARVLLVDDILTTGATCSEAARQLIKAGASGVAVVVAARAEGSDAA